MRVFVTAASKHGATLEIAEAIARALAEGGMEVDVRRPEDVDSLDAYDAAVVGSGVYMGSWLDAAQKLVARHEAELATRHVWLFSSGPIGDPPKPAPEEAVNVEKIVDAIRPRGHRVFGGKIDLSLLGFAERAVMRAVRAREGDYRDWAEIGDWAREIGSALQTEL